MDKFSIEHVNYYIAHICIIHAIESQDRHFKVEENLNNDVQKICNASDINVWIPNNVWG